MHIRLESLKVQREKREILHGISATFSPGLTYLLGLNGSGKTSLLHSLARLLPFEGKVWLDEQLLTHLPRNKVARCISMVQQQSRLSFPLSVYDFVLMGRFPYLNWLGAFAQSDREIAETYLELLQLTALSQRSIQRISGGEWQRVLIARALCQETPCLLLDEPAQSLDPLHKQQLYRLLEQLAAGGKTIVCATHDLEQLAHSQARVVGLKAGRLLLDLHTGMPREELISQVYG